MMWLHVEVVCWCSSGGQYLPCGVTMWQRGWQGFGVSVLGVGGQAESGPGRTGDAALSISPLPLASARLMC